MTILHISSSLEGGGAENMVLQLAKLSNPLIKTIVFSISDVNTLEPKFKSNNIEVHFLSVNSFKNSSLVDGIKKLNSIIKDIEDPVFHCHQFHGIMFGVLYNIFYSKIPIVATLHTNKVALYSRRFLLFTTKLFRKKDIIFSINSNKWYLKNSKVIPNGVDFSSLRVDTKRTYNNSEKFQFLFLGRMNKPKNPLYLVEAVEYLLNQNIDNFIINIVGHGDMRDELMGKINSKSYNNYFKFYGFQHNIKPFLVDSHCLILPSLWEGMPVAIIESAAAKLPIIATPVGSIPDFLDNSNSYISKLDSFHESMINVIKNYDNALKKSEILFYKMESTFDIKNVYKTHLDLYKKLV